MPRLLRLAQHYDEEDCPLEVRSRARELGEVIEDFTTTLASQTFLNLKDKGPKEVLEAYTHEHLHA
jgi:hypothetical protein